MASISAYDDGNAIIGPSKTFSALVHCSRFKSMRLNTFHRVLYT